MPIQLSKILKIQDYVVLNFFLKGDYKQKIRSEKDEKCSLGTGVENLKI